jgi:hypothetical protein
MQLRRLISVPVLGLAFWATLLIAADTKTTTSGPHWEIAGDLTEACTCSVPCTCNFNQGPSPHHYCYSLFALHIEKGHYGDLKLDDLRVAGAHGKKGNVWYIDERAAPEQVTALKAMLSHIDPKPGAHFETSRIVQEVGEKGNKLEVDEIGRFEADYIMGMDKKTPVIVENNTSWNIQKSIKGKTQEFHYKDRYGNKIDVKGSNSNQGKFDWTDETKEYF